MLMELAGAGGVACLLAVCGAGGLLGGGGFTGGAGRVGCGGLRTTTGGDPDFPSLSSDEDFPSAGRGRGEGMDAAALCGAEVDGGSSSA